MTDKRDLKRHVRERMERTGESYMTALRHVTARRESANEPIPYVELVDITDIANSFAIRCRVVKYPSLADVDPREALAALCLLLGKTIDDPAFDMFRDVLIGGERPRIRLDSRAETIVFANRVRAGIGGITNGGHMLAMHLGTPTGKRLVLYALQLTPDVAVTREPTLVLASADEAIGLATRTSRIHLTR